MSDDKTVNLQTTFEDQEEDEPLTSAMKREGVTRQTELGELYDPTDEFGGCGCDHGGDE